MKKITNIGLALIPALLAFMLVILDPLYSLDSMLCDKLYSQMNGCGNTIKLICIDEETMAQYGPLNTWSREKSAELINLLNEQPQFAPDVLALDIMYIGDGDYEQDESLVDAARKAGNVIVATNLVYRGKTKFSSGGVPYYDSWNIETEEKAYSALDAVVKSGYSNALLSKDGFVRTVQVANKIETVDRYCFAAQIYKEYEEKNGRSAVLPDANLVQFFYSGKPGEFIHYSMVDVLEGRIPVQEFKNSIVIVGAYAPGSQDAYHSSAKRGQDMYGVEINANIVKALMEGKTAKHVPEIAYALCLAVIFFIYTYLARAMKMYPAIIVGIWLLLAEGIAGRILAVNGYVMSLIYGLIMCLIIWAWVIIEKYVVETIKRKQTLNSFKKYMAPQVIENLAKSGDFHVELGGEKRHVAVLFVDIRGFTTLSESMSPEKMVQIINKYLSLTTECIFEHGGMLDKFIGDATMAIFNAPNNQDDYIYQAILAGIDMQKKGEILGQEIEREFGKKVSFGVGINAGEAVVGNIGCDTRMDYTAIGDTVNTASRIEGKAERGELLITENVYEVVKDRIQADYKDDMMLKGKAKPVKVYSVKGLKAEGK